MKLYGLHIAENKDSVFRFVAGSNEIKKLKDIVFTPDCTFYACPTIEREKTKMITHTTKDVYPYWAIYEMPYVV
ncbi:hypothetical protein VPHK71_0005 [Vibrio phage K71]|nr:hypothetical protein SIPHO078v2_p0005 [Vibrio phage 14E30.1]QZI92453.1 hypothetical protein SIPHO058v2_p0005 [Vibrio phage 14E30.2]